MSSGGRKTTSLVGAIFCIAAFVVSVIVYFTTTIVQLGFTTVGEKQIVNSLFWFGSAFLIAFAIMFLRDYDR